MTDQTSLRVPGVHFALRRAAQVATERVPATWLLQVRSAYFGSSQPGWARRWRQGVLELARLRGIPQDEPFSVPGQPDIKLVPTDSYIANYLYWLGLDAYEKGGPTWWGSLVATHSSALEIGANIGLYTTIGASACRSTPYRAVEPNPVSCEALRRNLELNSLDHVEVVQAAVVGGRTDENVILRFPDRDPYSASAGAFVDGALDLDASAARVISVPTVLAADLIDGVDLVKLDVEGLEVEILDAVRDWIVATRPTLVVEVRDDATHLQRYLAGLLDVADYACWAIADGRPVAIPVSAVTGGRLERDYRTRDVTLIDPDRASRAQGLFDG